MIEITLFKINQHNKDLSKKRHSNERKVDEPYILSYESPKQDLKKKTSQIWVDKKYIIIWNSYSVNSNTNKVPLKVIWLHTQHQMMMQIMQ